MKIAAFFDVDGTLLKKNTAILYLKALYRDKRISIFVLLNAFYYNLLHKFNLLDYEQMTHYSLKFMKGWDYEELRKYSVEHFNKDIKPLLSVELKKEIKYHRLKKHNIILLTSAPWIIVENIRKFVRADHSINSIIEVKNGEISGKYKFLCYKDKKLQMMKEMAMQHKIDLAKSYFYSDSYSDINALQAVGNPIAVNPDRKLHDYAKEKSWRIIYYA